LTEQIEQEPDFAAELFGSRIARARGYTQRLAADSETFGLLGPRELPRIWSRHVINSALLAELVPKGSKVVDVGSGAGLPGIPMALHSRMRISHLLNQWNAGLTGCSPLLMTSESAT